jgi:hypothetical protein
MQIGCDGRVAAKTGSARFAGQVFDEPVAGAAGSRQRRMLSGRWQWPGTLRKKGDRDQGVRDNRFASGRVQLGESPEVYRYPTTTGEYSAANPYA